MLLLDHKYREAKGHFLLNLKGKESKIVACNSQTSTHINIDKMPIIKGAVKENSPNKNLISTEKHNINSEETKQQGEIIKASEKLQRAKEIEMKRRKLLKQTYERKINELKNQVQSLEDENITRDRELENIEKQIKDAEQKLAAKRLEKLTHINSKDTYDDTTTNDR